MIHPSQQHPFGRRKPTCVVIVRDGKTRTFKLRPWVACVALSAMALIATGYVGATGYLIYRNDLFGAALTRQVSMQYAYEDRIAALRAELDRLTSRHAIETLGVDEQLSVLLRRQAVIERQHSTLGALVEQAQKSGVDVAEELARLPRARPDSDVASVDPADEAALAYAAGGAETDDIITGTLIRGADAQDTVQLRENLRPLLTGVQASLEGAQEQQAETLDLIGAAAESEVDELSAALAPLGVRLEADDAEPQGGPFLAARGLHFVERAALLERALDDVAQLRTQAAALPLRMPVTATRISSRFGTRMDPFLHRPALHAGLDFIAPTGRDVRATAAGTVVSAGWAGAYGNLVEVRHAGGSSTRYGHLSSPLVKEGEQIAAGTPVGLVGSTGRSTGPHLHYETRRHGDAVDPAPFLAAGRALQ